MLTTILFSLYNFSSSLGVFIAYGSPSSDYFYMSIIEVLLYGGLLGFTIWMLVTKDAIWMG